MQTENLNSETQGCQVVKNPEEIQQEMLDVGSETVSEHSETVSGDFLHDKDSSLIVDSEEDD